MLMSVTVDDKNKHKKLQADPYQEVHGGWSGEVVAVINLTLRKLNFNCCSKQLTFSYITCMHLRKYSK